MTKEQAVEFLESQANGAELYANKVENGEVEKATSEVFQLRERAKGFRECAKIIKETM